MFEGATLFNKDISSWNTSSVTTMKGMFNDDTSFNQEDLSLWNTSNVTDMSEMFDTPKVFSQDISSWNTSSVTTMTAMFQSATCHIVQSKSFWVGYIKWNRHAAHV
jgi:surface protein